jgi:hypothetical protein
LPSSAVPDCRWQAKPFTGHDNSSLRRPQAVPLDALAPGKIF